MKRKTTNAQLRTGYLKRSIKLINLWPGLLKKVKEHKSIISEMKGVITMNPIVIKMIIKNAMNDTMLINLIT